MAQQFKNNARALLVAGISDTATSIVIESAKADLFPVANVGTGSLPSANSWFKVTLQDSSGNVEIVAVRTRAAGSGILSSVIRGYDGTTALAFTAGTVVGLRITAADVQTALDLPNQNNTFSGNNTFTQPINADVVGDVTGSVTGNLTGNVTGNLTGNASGSSSSVATANWTFAQSGTKLVCSYDGAAKFSIDSSGNIIVTGNVTAYGTP